MPSAARAAALGSGLVVLLAVTGCVSNAAPRTTATAGAARIAVTSSADACDLSTTTAPSGTLTFTVSNTGSDVTEFYLYASDGKQVVGEVENIGPGLSRDLVVSVKPGTYVAACKPGMAGDGIRHDVTVTDSGTPVPTAGAAGLDDAEAAYVAYVRDQVGDLLTATQGFAAAVTAGDAAKARALYPAARAHYESVEPVAESFGELDGLLDAREADLADGEAWSGWHLLEKDLWPPAGYSPLTAEERSAAAADLVANTGKLVALVNDPSFMFEAFQITNGAKELLDEVATKKVTGEEEAWSHTDLSDLQANVDGAHEAYTAVADVVRAKDASLADELDQRFAAVDALLAAHGSIDAGFTLYDQLTSDQVKQLAAGVDALSEPLSRLTTTVTGA
jgi:iron uptake system component EfeO